MLLFVVPAFEQSFASFGAALPWPESFDPNGAKPRRSAGALIAIYQGEAVFYLERGGKTALTFAAPSASVAEALMDTCRRGRIDDFVVEYVDGERSTRSPWTPALKKAGFSVTPRGLSYTRPAW